MSKELTKRADNYSEWYNELVVKSQLADHSAVRGCMVIKPRGRRSPGGTPRRRGASPGRGSRQRPARARGGAAAVAR